MKPTWDFLDALELDETADARAIRRAYARKLKTIDQQADAAGFQALREAYETALNWAAYQADQAATEDAAPAQAVAPTAASVEAAAADAAISPAADPPGAYPVAVEAAAPPLQADPADEAQLAGAVIERLGEDVKQLNAAGRLGDPNAWHDALCARLRDEELVNLGARMRFEGFIVHVLGQGWQPGNEALFVAAVDAFGWASDRGALAQFGFPGRLLNQAVDEQALFAGQDATVRAAQENIARQLRLGEVPDAADLLRDLPVLDAMSERFPALLQVSASADEVERWRAAYRDLPAVRAGVALDTSVDAYKPDGSGMLRGFLLLMFLFSLLRYAYNQFDEPDPAPWGAAAAAMAQQRRVPEPDIVPTPEMMAAHFAPIDYKPGRAAKPGVYTVEYQVLLDADRSVLAANLRKSSGDPDYDAAVAAAVRAATPFPPNTAPEFVMTSSVTIKAHKRRKPAPGPSPPQAAPD